VAIAVIGKIFTPCSLFVLYLFCLFAIKVSNSISIQ
jgi:hypothetical protein